MNLLTLKDRIHDLDIQSAGDYSKLNDFEKKVLTSLRNLRFGSEKQNEILNSIEVKIFGHPRDRVEKTNVFKTGTL